MPATTGTASPCTVIRASSCAITPGAGGAITSRLTCGLASMSFVCAASWLTWMMKSVAPGRSANGTMDT